MTKDLGTTEKELIEVRKEKLVSLENKGINPYPSNSERNYMAADVREKEDQLITSKEEIIVAGRLLARRGHGKLVFGDLSDESGKIQVVFKADILAEAQFELLNLIDVGDFIEVKGSVFKTNAGELSIQALELRILTKSLRPLPEQWFGLKDEESRLRKRYLDFILNPKLKELFQQKERFWAATRDFLKSRGFLEVETPALETTAGGADANPFITHHNALDIDVYLRISMGELWQKRLMVAGFEKTFEIGRQFRNEGMSREHLQDYSQMEFYWAYANYEDSMALVEEMYKDIAEKAFGTLKFKIGEFDVDLSGKWGHIDYVDTIKEKLGIDVLDTGTEELKNKLRELKLHFDEKDSRGRLIDILWKQIRKGIAGPVFLINHPVEVSPLAKRKDDDPRKVERYQIILAGSEMGNGYSELNDPIDQRNRFEEQAKMREAGDDEAQMNDTDFVEALEYGMPPTTGFGFSERLFSFLADKTARECQMFPLMRPHQPKARITNNQETNTKQNQDAKMLKLATIVLNSDAKMLPWQRLNTAAHLSASFAARNEGKDLLYRDTVATKDGKELKLNIQHAIMIREASKSSISNLITSARQSGIDVFEFSREMLETTNDKKVAEQTAAKNLEEIELLGILLFGEKGKVEELTKDLKLVE
ncbi:MAG TPA: lysine--tRNA ligase [bacterium]|nr:lysine--tRNA ligase [bacterium]